MANTTATGIAPQDLVSFNEFIAEAEAIMRLRESKADEMNAQPSIGDVEVICWDCSIVDKDNQIRKELEARVDAFLILWNKRGWVHDFEIDEDTGRPTGTPVPVYGDENEPIASYIWDEEYSKAVEAAPSRDEAYKARCEKIKREHGFLPKPIWIIEERKLREAEKQVFMAGIKDKFNARMAAANEYIQINWFKPLKMFKLLSLTRPTYVVAHKDVDGIHCPICGSTHVRAQSAKVPGEVFTENDGYDKIHRFDLDEVETISSVKDKKTGEAKDAYVLEKSGQEYLSDVIAENDELIEEFNDEVKRHKAEQRFFNEIAPFADGIVEACKMMGYQGNLIADIIADYYEIKMSL